MRFAKGHGTENDFVLVPDPAGEFPITARLAARLCDRRAGLGADGVLRIVRTAALGDEAPPPRTGAVPGPVPEWFMDYRNADGSLAEMCGNGIRVFARYLIDSGLAAGPELAIATRSGTRRVRQEGTGDISAGLGPAAVLGPGSAVAGGRACDGLRISVGNPHLACVTGDPLDSFDLSAPPALDPAAFPQGANLELVRVTGPGSLSMRVHERGSGETRSCGTGAVAAALAAAVAAGPAGGPGAPAGPGRTGTGPGGKDRVGKDRVGTDHVGKDHGRWQVTVPGGTLTVTLETGAAWLTGPAVIVAEGELDPAWLAAAAR
ncbi:MAG TPA: diaminopimelate epimerase [Streptosporangiaceae bacterium]|nr:diaminopimelate epimerase [Streptosporangiaceae bacterium]